MCLSHKLSVIITCYFSSWTTRLSNMPDVLASLLSEGTDSFRLTPRLSHLTVPVLSNQAVQNASVHVLWLTAWATCLASVDPCSFFLQFFCLFHVGGVSNRWVHALMALGDLH